MALVRKYDKVRERFSRMVISDNGNICATFESVGDDLHCHNYTLTRHRYAYELYYFLMNRRIDSCTDTILNFDNESRLF